MTSPYTAVNEVRTTRTAGPWHQNGREITSPSKPSLTVAYAGKGWCAGVDGSYSISDEEARANARLIAAAPAMLEALHKAREWLEGWGSAEHQLDVINAAIASAESSS